jgi:molybdenum cofactor biosynthesis protein MoaC
MNPYKTPVTYLNYQRLYSTSTKAIGDKSPQLTHLDEHGRASMVDVSNKQPTKRTATATGRIYIPKIAYHLVTKTYTSEEADSKDSSRETQAGDVQWDKAIEKARRKGDALTVAHLAGIMGAKATSSLIPLCHPLSLSKIDILLTPQAPEASTSVHIGGARYSILCEATVTCEGKTGVEMEALTAVSVSLLTVWDMLKAVAGKEMEIRSIMVTQKSGGKSGDFVRDNAGHKPTGE